MHNRNTHACSTLHVRVPHKEMPNEFLYFMLENFTKNLLAITIFKPRVTKHIVFQTDSRRIRWTEHVANMGTGEVFWWGNLRESDRVEEPRVNGKIFKDRPSGCELGWYGLD